jgi:multiple sugar transport system ATP-binding protein
MASVGLRSVSKAFSDEVEAVRDVSLEIRDGEFIVLVGPSGSGKSTLLRLIAGLERPTAGDILIGDRVVTTLRPKSRDIAMVFQNYALYPHMNVRQNLAFSLEIRRVSKDEVERRVQDVARTLGLGTLLKRKPAELSGGQRQRVAMGRAMVRDPQVLLLDEPLSNLDAALRVEMRTELKRIHYAIGTTSVYVTHDQVEAMTLGDRVAVLRGGQLQQIATPLEIYRRPANVFVAAFIGSPAMNLVEATVSSDRFVAGGYELPLPPGADLNAYEGRKVILGIRPNDFVDAGISGDHRPTIETVIDLVEELGPEVHLDVRLDPSRTGEEGISILRFSSRGELSTTPAVAAGGQGTLRAIVDARTRARRGDAIVLGVDPRAFHVFDADSGLAIHPNGGLEGASGQAGGTADDSGPGAPSLDPP